MNTYTVVTKKGRARYVFNQMCAAVRHIAHKGWTISDDVQIDAQAAYAVVTATIEPKEEYTREVDAAMNVCTQVLL